MSILVILRCFVAGHWAGELRGVVDSLEAFNGYLPMRQK